MTLGKEVLNYHFRNKKKTRSGSPREGHLKNNLNFNDGFSATLCTCTQILRRVWLNILVGILCTKSNLVNLEVGF